MNNTRRRILEKIKKKEIRMKPRWIFWLEEAGAKSGLGLILLLVAIGLSMVVMFWQVYNPSELTEYGEAGWALIREDFPYLWLLGAVVLGIGGVVLESKLGENYKRTTTVLVFLTTATIVGLTALTVWARNLLQIGF